MSAANSQTSSSSSPSSSSSRSCLPDTSCATRTIAFGHVTSAVCVTVAACAAASLSRGKSIGPHAVFLFFVNLIVRLTMLRQRPLDSEVYSPTEEDMCLGAATLFVSNSLVAIAALMKPDMFLELIAFSALDVTANWLYMVAAAKTPCRPLPASLVLSCSSMADLYLVFAICNKEVWMLHPLGIYTKGVQNIYLTFFAAFTVVARDTARRNEVVSHLD